ncbi:MAG: family 78 glycoside hydrolase catalytic domain [Chloroflexota bacterium]
MTNPVGLDVLRPRLSWELRGGMQVEQRNAKQTSFRLIVADSLEILNTNKGNVWDSRRVTTGQSTQRIFDGQSLKSRQRYFWKVMVWDEKDSRTGWSEPAFWEMGLLDAWDWDAQWIGVGEQETDAAIEMPPVEHYQTRFMVDEGVASARLYATALGTYELQLDGERVGADYFTPGWTNYHKRVQYQTYDVTAQMTAGEHVLEGLVADGWYRGYLMTFKGKTSRERYGERLALKVQLEIRYENGRSQTITTHPKSWQASLAGPIRYADHYIGEYYDARQETISDWQTPEIIPPTQAKLVAQIGAPVRKMHEIEPIAILTSPKGETIVDFGQNMVGWVRLRVRGEAGTAVSLHHAEILDQDGSFYTENLRAAKQMVTYVCKGAPEDEIYEPGFTFQGFRYVLVEGYPGELTLESLTGVVLSSDLAETGSFECSNPLINQLQQNIVWGQRGNFLEVPTDCPQRDERLGWTGDAQVFAATACFNMDVASFLTRWLRNVSDDRRADGAIPHVVPNVLGDDAAGATGWADAAIIVPWTLYLHYGDIEILRQHYGTMQRWVGYMYERAGKDLIWRGDFHFGDWLATDRDDLGTPFGITETDLIATAFYAHSTGLLANIARLLGREEDAQAYARIAEAVAAAFCDEFVTKNGRIGTNTQTAYVLALMFDLLPEEQQPEAARRLVENIRERGNHLATGFLGTPYLCHVLTDFGYLDVAYDLLLQESCPSWLYPVKMGATTIWERWDGVKASGEFQNAGMNSFNHYAYGAIGNWLYSVVAGLVVDPMQPGYKHSIIQPNPGGGLTYAKATLKTPYGELASHWVKEGNELQLNLTIPVNTTATVLLPTAQAVGVLENDEPLDLEGNPDRIGDLQEITAVEIGSGQYHFVVSYD